MAWISKVHTNNGFQLVVSAHIFHILVSHDGSTSSHWGTKSGAFCEAVNWLLCNSNQEGKFLFYAVMLVPTYSFPSHGFICLHCFFLRCWFQSDGFIWVKPYVPFLWCWFSVDGSILFSCYGGIYLLMIWVRLFHALVPWDNANVEPKLKNVYCSIQNSKTKQMYISY